MDPILDTPHSYSAPGPGPHLTLPRPCKRTRIDHAAMLHSDTCCGPRGRAANNPYGLDSPDSAPDVSYMIDHPLECTCRLAALPALPLPHETPSPQSQQTQQRRFIAAWATNPSQPQPSPPDAAIVGSPACTHGCDLCMPADEGPQAAALSSPHPPAPPGPTPPTYPLLAQQHAHHPNMNPVSPRRAPSPPPPPAPQGNLVTCGIPAAVGHADPSVPSELLVAATAAATVAAGQGGTATGAQATHPMQASGESPNNDAHVAARVASGFINPGGTASVEEGAEGGPAPDEDGGVVLDGFVRQASTSGGGEATDADRLPAWELTLCAAAGWRAPVLPPVTTGQPTAVEPCTYSSGPCIAVAGSCAMGLVRATGAVWPQRKALNVIVQNGCETAHSQPVGGFDYAKMWRVVGDTLEWPGQAPAPPGTAPAPACGSALPLGAACGSIESGVSLLAGPGSLPQSSLPSNVVTTGNIIERILAPLSPTGGGGSGGGSTLTATGSGPSSVRQSPSGPVTYTLHPEQPQPHATSQEQPWPYSTGPALGAVLMMGGGLEGAAPMPRLVASMCTRPGLAPNAVTTGAAPVSAAAEALAAGAVSRRRLGCSSGGGRDGFSRACIVVGGYDAHEQSGEECSEDGSSSSEGEEEEEEEAGDGGAHDGATSSSASRGGLGGGGFGAVEDVGAATDWQQPQQQQRPLPLAAHQLESLWHQQALTCPAAPVPIRHAVQHGMPYPYAAPPVPYAGTPAYRSRYIPGMSGGCWVPAAGAFVPPLPTGPLGAVGGHCAPCGGDKGGEGKGKGQASHRAGPQVVAQVNCGNALSDRGPPETPVAMGGPYLSYTCYGGAGVVSGGGPLALSAAGASTTPPETRHMPVPTHGTDRPQHMYKCCVCAKRYLPPSDAADMAVQQSSAKQCRRRLFTTPEEPVWPAGVSYMGVGDLPTQHPVRPGSPGPTCPSASTAAVVAATAAAVSAATAAHQAVAANAAPAIQTAADGHQRCEDGTPPSGNAAQYGNSWLGPWSAATPTRQHLSASGATPTEPNHPPPHYPHPSIQPQPQPHPRPQQQPHAQPQQQPQPQPQQMPAWAYTGMYAAPKPYGDHDNSYRHGRRGPSGPQRDAGNYETVEYDGEVSAVGSRRSSYSSGDAAAVVAEAAVGVLAGQPAQYESGAPEPVSPRQPQRYSADAAMGNGDGWSVPPAPSYGNGTAGRLLYDGHATNSVGTAVAQSVSGGADGTSSIGPCGCTACMQARALVGQGAVQSAAPDDTPTVYGTVMAAPPPPPPPHAAGGPVSSSWSAPLVHSVSVQPPPYNGCNCELCRRALAAGHNPPTRLRSFISRQMPSGPTPPPSHRHYHHHHHHHRYQHQPHHQSHPRPYLPQHPPPPRPMQIQAPLNSIYPIYSTHMPAYPPPGPTYRHAPSRSFHNAPPPPPSSFLSHSTPVEWPTAGPAGIPPSKAKTHAAPDVTAPPPPASSALPCPCPVCKAAVPSHHHSQQPGPTYPGSPIEPPTTAQQAPAPITAQTTAPAPNESRPRDGFGHIASDRPGGTSCGAGAPRTSHGSVLCAEDASSAATGTHTHVPAEAPPLSAPTPFASSQPLSGPTTGPSTVSQSPHCWASAAAPCTAVCPAMAPPMQRPPYTHPSYSHGSYVVPSTASLPMGPTHRPVEPTPHALHSSIYTSHPAAHTAAHPTSHPASLTPHYAEPDPHAPADAVPAAAAGAGGGAGAGAASPYPPWCSGTQPPAHPSSQNMCSRVSVPPVPHQFDTPTPSQHHIQPSPDNRLNSAPAWMPPPHRAAQQPHYHHQQHLPQSQAASCPHQPPTPARTESPGNCPSHVASVSNPMVSSQTTLLTMTAAGAAAPVTQSAQAPPRHTAAGHLPYGHMQAPPPPSQHPAVQPPVPPSPSLTPSARHAHTNDTAAPLCSTSFPQHHQQHQLQCYQQTAAPPTCPPKAQLPSYPHHHHPPHHLPSHPPQHPQHPPPPPPPPREHSTSTPAQPPITRSTGSTTTTHPSPPQGQPPAPPAPTKPAPTQPPPLTVLGTVTCSTMDLTSGCSRPGFCDHCGSAMVEPAQLPMAAGTSCGLQTPEGMMSPPQPQPHSGPQYHNHLQYHNHHNHHTHNRQNPNHQSQPQREGEVVRAQHTAGMMMHGCEQPPPPPPQAQAAPLSSEHPHATEPQQLGAKEQLGERGMPLQPQQLQRLQRQEQQQQQLQHLHQQQQQQQQQQECSHHYQQQAVVTLWEQGVVPVQQQRQVEVSAPEVGNGGKVHEEEDAMWADNPLAAWPGRARRSVLSGVADV